MSGSGIIWAICKSAPSSRQITTPAPHHSVFYRLDALPAAQPTASKHRRPYFYIHAWCKFLLYCVYYTVLFCTASKVVTMKQCSGKIVVKSKNSGHKLTIPYQSSVLHGLVSLELLVVDSLIVPNHVSRKELQFLWQSTHICCIFWSSRPLTLVFEPLAGTHFPSHWG